MVSAYFYAIKKRRKNKNSAKRLKQAASKLVPRHSVLLSSIRDQPVL